MDNNVILFLQIGDRLYGQVDFQNVVGFDTDDMSSNVLQDYEVWARTANEKLPGFDRVVSMDLWVTFKRYWVPFVMKYHIPSAGIALICHISYVIPPSTAIPGRVALLATNFLALTNIFSSHQVSLGIKDVLPKNVLMINFISG